MTSSPNIDAPPTIDAPAGRRSIDFPQALVCAELRADAGMRRASSAPPLSQSPPSKKHEIQVQQSLGFQMNDVDNILSRRRTDPAVGWQPTNTGHHTRKLGYDGAEQWKSGAGSRKEEHYAHPEQQRPSVGCLGTPHPQSDCASIMIDPRALHLDGCGQRGMHRARSQPSPHSLITKQQEQSVSQAFGLHTNNMDAIHSRRHADSMAQTPGWRPKTNHSKSFDYSGPTSTEQEARTRYAYVSIDHTTRMGSPTLSKRMLGCESPRSPGRMRHDEMKATSEASAYAKLLGRSANVCPTPFGRSQSLRPIKEKGTPRSERREEADIQKHARSHAQRAKAPSLTARSMRESTDMPGQKVQEILKIAEQIANTQQILRNATVLSRTQYCIAPHAKPQCPMTPPNPKPRFDASPRRMKESEAKTPKKQKRAFPKTQRLQNAEEPQKPRPGAKAEVPPRHVAASAMHETAVHRTANTLMTEIKEQPPLPAWGNKANTLLRQMKAAAGWDDTEVAETQLEIQSPLAELHSTRSQFESGVQKSRPLGAKTEDDTSEARAVPDEFKPVEAIVLTESHYETAVQQPKPQNLPQKSRTGAKTEDDTWPTASPDIDESAAAAQDKVFDVQSFRLLDKIKGYAPPSIQKFLSNKQDNPYDTPTILEDEPVDDNRLFRA